MSINARLVWDLGTPQVGQLDLHVRGRTTDFGSFGGVVTDLDCWVPVDSFLPLSTDGMFLRCGATDHPVKQLQFAQSVDALGLAVTLRVEGCAVPLIDAGMVVASGFSAVAQPGGGPWPSGELVDHDGAAALVALQRAADRQGVSVETLLARLEPPPPEPAPDGLRGIALDGLTKETPGGQSQQPA